MCVALLQQYGMDDKDLVLLIGSYGASAVLVYAAPGESM